MTGSMWDWLVNRLEETLASAQGARERKVIQRAMDLVLSGHISDAAEVARKAIERRELENVERKASTGSKTHRITWEGAEEALRLLDYYIWRRHQGE